MVKLAMLLVLVGVLALTGPAVVSGRARFVSDPELDADWTAWKAKFGETMFIILLRQTLIVISKSCSTKAFLKTIGQKESRWFTGKAYLIAFFI